MPLPGSFHDFGTHGGSLSWLLPCRSTRYFSVSSVKMECQGACSGLSQVMADFFLWRLPDTYLRYIQKSGVLNAIETLMEVLLQILPDDPVELLRDAIAELKREGDLKANTMKSTLSLFQKHFSTATSGREDESSMHRHRNSFVSSCRSECSPTATPHTTKAATLHRMQDGIRDTAESAVVVPRSRTRKNLVEALLEMPALDWHGYQHCPVCNRITQVVGILCP